MPDGGELRTLCDAANQSRTGIWELRPQATGCLCMRTRVRQELRTALLIAIGLAVLCFGAAAIAAKLIGQS